MEQEGRFYTEDEVQEMRSAGASKPDNITWSQWLGPKKLNARHNLICYLASIGYKTDVIAEHVGLSKERVAVLLNNPKIRNEIQYLQRQLFKEDPKNRFSGLLPAAIETIEEVMKNPNERGQTRLAAANIVQERVLGKPTQQVDIGQNLIRALFERLDDKKRNIQAIDVTQKELPLLQEPTLEDNVKEERSEDVRAENYPVDSWIADNLGEK